MSWWKTSKRCPVCGVKYKKNTPFHELRIGAADGMLEIEICDECARFWDASAEVLSKGRNKDDEGVKDE